MTGDTPAALMARDYHSLWLNSAALAHANGDLEVAGGVVERDERGEPTGVLREECAWHFRDTYVRPTEDEMVEASREGMRIAIARGVTAVHDKDGWLGALGVWQRLREEGSLHVRIWQSIPAEQVDDLEALHLQSGFGDDLVRIGYLKAFMDGTLGSQTARLLDGSAACRSRAVNELVEIIRRGAAAGLPVAVHAIGDLANREALDAFEETPRPLAAGRAPSTASSTRSCSRWEDCRDSRSSVWLLPSSSATHLPITTWPSASGPARPTAPTRTGRCGTRAPCSQTGPTHRSRSWPPGTGSAQRATIDSVSGTRSSG